MVNSELLTNCGLSKGEVKVYLALLDLGKTSAGKIHEKIGIDRRNVYDLLNKLSEKGLISFGSENKQKYFQPSSPNKLLRYVSEKNNALAKIQKELVKELPILEKKLNSHKTTISGEIYRGKEGIKAVWDDMLNHKELYWIGSGRYVPKKLPVYFSQWNKKRIKLKIPIHNLLRQEMRKEIKIWELEHTKYLPSEFSKNPIVICIQGDKVANLMYGKEFFAFVIQSEELAENYRAYHKYLWDHVAID